MKITESINLLIISLFLIFLIFGKSKFFNIKDIFLKYLAIFNRSIPNIIIVFILPLNLVFLTNTYQNVDKSILDNILIVLSIYVGILFSILSDLSAKNNLNERQNTVRKQTINICIFIATETILCIMLSVGLLSPIFDFKSPSLWMKLTNGLNFYLIFSIVLNTMIVFKRYSRLSEFNS